MGEEVSEAWVEFEGDGRRLEGVLARPKGGERHPAVILLHEMWGIDDHIRERARGFAEAGYVALVPDPCTGPLREQMRPENIRDGMRLLQGIPDAVKENPKLLRERVGGMEMARETREVVKRLMEVANQERREALARDLEGAFAYLGQRPDVDRDQIGLVRDDPYHKVRRGTRVW